MRWLALLVLVGCEGSDDSGAPDDASTFDLEHEPVTVQQIACSDPGSAPINLIVRNRTDEQLTVSTDAPSPGWIADPTTVVVVEASGWASALFDARIPCEGGALPIGEHRETITATDVASDEQESIEVVVVVEPG